VQNIIKISQMVVEIWPFFSFSRLRTSAMLDFQILKILMVDRVWRSQMHYCAKFRQVVVELWQFFDLL